MSVCQPKVRRWAGARNTTARMWMRSTATLYRHWIVVGYYLRNSSSLLITWRAVRRERERRAGRKCYAQGHLK